jgi:replication-associated recombination protein RarA
MLAQKNRPPLAERMRPRELDEYYGQEKLLAEGGCCALCSLAIL